MRAAIYARVSTDAQSGDDKTSLGDQQTRCEAMCVANAWEVSEVYADTTSGARWDRPALQRLLEDAAQGYFERVVFLSIDRLGRDLHDLTGISKQLQAADVGIVSVKEQFDTGTLSGKLFFQLLGAFAEFERGRIAERMRVGIRGRVQSGKYQAPHPPYGYVYDRDTGTLSEHPEEADIVRWMFDSALQGASCMHMALDLNRRDVPPPSRAEKWRHDTIWKFLRNRRYAGEQTYGSETMQIEALVSMDEFDRAQVALQRRKTRQKRSTKKFYVLQHLVFCRRCDSMMGASMDTNRNEPAVRYRCLKFHNTHEGHEGVVKNAWYEHHLLSRLWTGIARMESEQGHGSVFHEQMRLRFEQVERSTSSEKVELKHQTARYVNLHTEEKRVLVAYRRGVYTDDGQFEQELTEVRDEIALVRSRIAELREQEPEFNRDEAWRAIKRLFSPIRLNTTPEEWSDFAHQFIERLWVEDDGAISVDWRVQIDALVLPPLWVRQSKNSALTFTLQV